MEKTPRVLAACAAAWAACAADAADLQPLDVMGPYDTPAVAADRIALPEHASDAGRQQSEFAIERAYAASDGTGLTGIYPFDEGGDRAKPDKPQKPEKPDKPAKPGG